MYFPLTPKYSYRSIAYQQPHAFRCIHTDKNIKSNNHSVILIAIHLHPDDVLISYEHLRLFLNLIEYYISTGS